jgi:hypothetical protein
MMAIKIVSERRNKMSEKAEMEDTKQLGGNQNA